VNDGMRVMKAPKAKLPYIVDDNGTVVADTTFTSSTCNAGAASRSTPR
jgi:hypothetical protein